MDHIFWGVVSIGILAVLLSLLLKMLIEDFPASFSSVRRTPNRRSISGSFDAGQSEGSGS